MADPASFLKAHAPSSHYRSGTGTPLVLLHGITGTWPIWAPVLTALTREHDVLALTLPGHWGGPEWPPSTPVTIATLADRVEQQLDEHGIDTAHIVGNSLGGWLSLELGRRGRARSVVALSPAGGWSSAADVRRVVRLLSGAQRSLRYREVLRMQHLAARPRFRKLAFGTVMQHADRIPSGDALLMMEGAAGCEVFEGFMKWVATTQPIGPPAVAQGYPIRIAWAEHDKTIPFERYGRPLLASVSGAEQITLHGVGHVPMYDDPELVVRTILEVTRRTDSPDNSATQTSDRSHPMSDTTLTGERGNVIVRKWSPDGDPTRAVVIAHGFGEHSGRYEHVAQALVADGAVVYAPDHHGHGRSDGKPALIESIDDMAEDVGKVVALAASENPGLPLALIGHSLGGLIVTRFVQRHIDDHGLSALVLSGPIIGGNPAFEALIQMDPIPDVPIDPAVLSRDPAVGEAYAADPLVYHGPIQKQSLETMFAAVADVKAGPSFGALPTLWVHGENDGLAPVDATRPAIEHVKGDSLEEHIYPGAAHEVFNETNKDEVIGTVSAFINARVGAPA